MSTFSRLSEVFNSAITLPFDESSKIVLMSDCHRGDGSWSDIFAPNYNIYFAALKHYYSNGYTYIELGDCDELWKTKTLTDISRIYVDIFRLLARFHSENRLFIIFGNHDIEKRDVKFSQEYMQSYYDPHSGLIEPLFENIDIHEGIILRHSETGVGLFLVHGHQGNKLDDRLWKLSRFLVRHILRRLEMIGFNDMTSAAKNNVKKRRVEKKITRWAEAMGQITIAGHTHRPVCSADPTALYFNAGSGVHPNCITCLEIVGGVISLYKWRVKTRDDGSLYVDRQLIAVPRKLYSS